MDLSTVRERFRAPLAADRMMPLWFWNDHLDENQITARLAEFADHGLGGVVVHPRQGWPPELGYLTDRWFELVRHACDESARLGLKVIIYDEGVYPSGASGGLVTRDRPEFQARGLQEVRREVDGGTRSWWRVTAGEEMDDHLVAVVATPLRPDGAPDPSGSIQLEVDDRQLVRLDLPAGRWRVSGFLNVLTGGHIRGLYAGQDDRGAEPPPAADLLNPLATARFLATTHEAYAGAIGDHFGQTVIGFFVDEPSLPGRGARRGGLQPWTTGFEADLGPTGWRLLPALFDEAWPAGETARSTFETAVSERLNATFYGPLAEWCEARGLALLGHPDESENQAALDRFTWPGQDMVWRYIEPGDRSGIEGRHSTAAHTATSAKRLAGRARSTMECLGAYGWQLTADEMKWLLDWHLVRGNDLLMPHAFYESIRGPRAYERPPCSGPHNLWWDGFRPLADYVGRVCAMLQLGEPVVETAVACNPVAVDWRPAVTLQERQIDFDYVPSDRLDLLARYRQVLVSPTVTCPPGVVAVAPDAADGRAVWLSPEQPAVRAWQRRLGEARLLFLVNEGEEPVGVDAWLPLAGAVEVWDPLGGEMTTLPSETHADGMRWRVDLERRQGLLYLVDPSRQPGPGAPPLAAWTPAGTLADWEWAPNGRDWQAAGLTDWCERRELETFSGAIAYRTSFVTASGEHYHLDLGRVEQLAEVLVDGRSLGWRMWAPYWFALPELSAGGHELVVRVANSRANELLGSMLPSGLFGPVMLSRQAG